MEGSAPNTLQEIVSPWYVQRYTLWNIKWTSAKSGAFQNVFHLFVIIIRVLRFSLVPTSLSSKGLSSSLCPSLVHPYCRD